MKLTENCIEAL